ncbi:MAG: hypothetical protein AAF902_12060 [Chloroflexota bacterium]
MNILKSFSPLLLVLFLIACSISAESITSSATGEVITTMTADGTGGGSPFDGTVDSAADLDDLVETAWGVSRLGLHRGHAPIESVLEAYLGITHDEMHVFMEDEGLNLAQICERFGFDPENLVDTLTASFVPHLEEGVENGVLAVDEVAEWEAKIRTEFSNRVYWEG